HCTHVTWINRHLVTKASTDIWRDDTDAVFWQPCDDGEERAVGVRRLRGHPDCEFPRCFTEVGYAATCLNRRGMNTRNVHLLPDDHAVGFGFGKGGIGCR